jgi:hypothetical protein
VLSLFPLDCPSIWPTCTPTTKTMLVVMVVVAIIILMDQQVMQVINERFINKQKLKKIDLFFVFSFFVFGARKKNKYQYQCLLVASTDQYESSQDLWLLLAL